MDSNGWSEEERRRERRRRRHRNQAAAYVLLVVLLAAAAAGIYFMAKRAGELKQQESQQEEERQDEEAQEEDLLDELVGSEPPLTLEEEPEEPEPEPTPEEKLEALIDDVIAQMTLEDKVAGLFIVTPEAITGVDAAVQAGDGTREALEKYAVGGLVYFAQNIQSKEQITQMLANSAQFARYPLFFAIDEEGGSVSRIASAGLADKVASAQEIGQGQDPAAAYQAGATIASYLSELGFNLDFAPVADVASVEGSVMTSRAYGSDATVTSPFVVSMIQGLSDGNIISCMKHFPGLGGSGSDTHQGLAVLDRTEDEFRANEFVAFKAGIDAGAPMIMVGHAAAPSLTGDNTPCTMSETVVTDLLREELDFRGVIITDAMNMKAISDYYAADEAAIYALKAGCDMILMPDDFQKAYEGVLQKVREGVIAEERINNSLRRIYRIKYADQVE